MIGRILKFKSELLCLPGLAAGLLAMIGLKAILNSILQTSTALATASIPGAFLVVLCCGHGSRRRHGTELRLMARGLALVIGIHIFFSWIPRIPIELQGEGPEYIVLMIGRWLALVSVLLTFWRPSFLLVVALYLYIGKLVLQKILMIPAITKVDYMLLVDLALLLVLAPAIRTVMVAFRTRYPRVLSAQILVGPRIRFNAALINASIGFYLGNYFWAGIKKAALGGSNPLDWVINNHTAVLVSVSHIGGWVPFGQVADSARLMFEVLDALGVALNTCVLTAQIGSSIFILTRRLTVLGMFVYIGFHTGIFLSTGILFSFWILLALVFVIVLRNSRLRGYFRRDLVFRSLALVTAPVCIYLIPLGWFDTQAMNHFYFEAEDANGDRYKVPTNYFLYGATAIPKGRFGRLGVEVFPTGAFGTTFEREVRDHMLKFQGFPEETPPPPRLKTNSFLVRFVQNYHAIVLENADGEGLFNYNLFGHHLVSNPARFKEFRQLDKRSIEAYHYVIDAIWLSDSTALEGVLKRRVEVRIPVLGQALHVSDLSPKVWTPASPPANAE